MMDKPLSKLTHAKLTGDLRESNPRPFAPKANIIPLDQSPVHQQLRYNFQLVSLLKAIISLTQSEQRLAPLNELKIT